MQVSIRHDPFPVGEPYRGIYAHGVETRAVRECCTSLDKLVHRRKVICHLTFAASADKRS